MLQGEGVLAVVDKKMGSRGLSVADFYNQCREKM